MKTTYQTWKPNFSIHISPEPTNDELLFVRQLGVSHVYTWIKEDQINYDFLFRLKKKVESNHLVLYNVGNMDVGKSPLIHLGLSGRDERIARFIELIDILGRLDIAVTTFTWEPDMVWSSEPRSSRDSVARFVDLDDLKRKPLTHGRKYSLEELWDNYTYFTSSIVPALEDAGVRLALHPNDPPTDELGGIPCLINSMERYKKAYRIAPSKAMAMEFCAGCWLEGGSGFGDILQGLRYFIEEDRVAIIHFRNISSPLPVFTETFLDNGYMDMYLIMKLLAELQYQGTVTLDHTPRFVDYAGNTAATAYAIGYMRALYERAMDELGGA